jgi:hypothetical protein
MKATTFATSLVLACLLAASGARAQAPSLEDLARMHGSGGSAAPAPAPTPMPAPSAPRPSAGGSYYGAIAFTADGSYSTAWKYRTKAEAEAYVATKCAGFGRGQCKVIGFTGTLCAGLASYQGTHSGRRYKLAFTGGGTTASDAQRAALDRCNNDSRTRRRCQLRTVVCGDGR